MTTTPLASLPYPSGAVGVAPDVPGDIRALALALDPKVAVLTETLSAFSGYTLASDALNRARLIGNLAIIDFAVKVNTGNFTNGAPVAGVPSTIYPVPPITFAAACFDAANNWRPCAGQLNSSGQIVVLTGGLTFQTFSGQIIFTTL